MEPSWLSSLNVLSPDTSPMNGPQNDLLRTEANLSYPVPSDELTKQLEAWTNVELDPFQPSSESFFNNKVNPHKKPLNFENGFSNYFTAVAGSPSIDPLLYSPFTTVGAGLSSTGVASDGSNMLIHPTAFTNLPLHNPADTPSDSSSNKTSASKPKTGNKRGRKPLLSNVVDPNDPNAEVTQKAIEDDKRRRNTAASARFRVKKKEREQAMASTVKELQDKMTDLEKQVENLTMENTWLRKLIFDKSGQSADEVLKMSGQQ